MSLVKISFTDPCGGLKKWYDTVLHDHPVDAGLFFKSFFYITVVYWKYIIM